MLGVCPPLWHLPPSSTAPNLLILSLSLFLPYLRGMGCFFSLCLFFMCNSRPSFSPFAAFFFTVSFAVLSSCCLPLAFSLPPQSPMFIACVFALVSTSCCFVFPPFHTFFLFSIFFFLLHCCCSLCRYLYISFPFRLFAATVLHVAPRLPLSISSEVLALLVHTSLLHACGKAK